LFLDEISALSLDSQARLLRLVRPCDDSDANADQGGAADIRLITSTHRDLEPLVAQGRFLAELYGCLSATTLTVPPLRERGDDIIEIEVTRRCWCGTCG
jgi:DNA-binding NtrC family response regulator